MVPMVSALERFHCIISGRIKDLLSLKTNRIMKKTDETQVKFTEKADKIRDRFFIRLTYI